MSNPYEQDLDKNSANFVALSPLGFLERTAKIYPDRISLIHGELRYTWAQTHKRCLALAGFLASRGIGKGDTVSIIAPNTPALYEAHFAAPMTGAVLNTLNTRLNSDLIAFILTHAETKLILVDCEFSEVVEKALERLDRKIDVVGIADDAVQHYQIRGSMNYEQCLCQADFDFEPRKPVDEWDAISLNYTSGTTGNPKGVVYHHRGAYLNSISNAINWKMKDHPVYLWTLPMFHCNGWCFPWTIALMGGTNVCMRKVTAENIYKAIENYGITHFCGAPIILSMLVNAINSEIRSFPHTVEVMTAAAPPPPAVLMKMEQAGFHVTHVYGLTETYGPAVICEWHSQWNELEDTSRAEMKSRQGVPYTVLEELEILDTETMETVQCDRTSMGEVMFRGNNVMKGYLKNPDATEEAFEGGWFHSGDLGVMHPDRYIQLKDRSKDVIISGGENISSIEVEDALFNHPAVLEAAVVARPDEKWGETPCAFVTLNPAVDPQPSEEDIIRHCKQNMAHFKAPQTVVFGGLPKTSTGKVQKFILRQRAEAL